MRPSALRRRLAVTTAAASCVLASAAPSRAQSAAPVAAQSDSGDAEACFSAAERAQPLLRQKRLREARAVLETCARDACPRAARTDCRQWLAEATDAQPSILVVAHETRGPNDTHDIHGVRATVDETTVVENADATPLVIDPGRHRIKLERPDAPAVEQTIDVHDGDHNLVVDFYWRAGGPTAGSRPIPTSVYVTLGIAGGAVALGTAFEIAGLTKRGSLSGCQATRSCSQGDVDAARSLTRVGDISLGAAALFAVSGAILYLVRPTVEPPAAPSEASWLIAPVPGGVVGGLRLHL
jgi:hypothetical protein